MIIGASSSETNHRVRTSQGWHFVHCGADILLNGVRSDLEAEGKCPVCGNNIRFRIRNSRVLELDPDDSILHVVELPAKVDGRFQIECEGSLLFDRIDCLNTWLKGYKGRPGSIFRPQEFMERIIKLRSQHLPGRS